MEKGILDLLKRTSINGFKLNDCEPELQELVSHLDGYVSFFDQYIFESYMLNFNC